MKSASVEVSEVKEKHVIGPWRKKKKQSVLQKKKILAALYTAVGQKAELASNELEYLAEDIFKPSVEVEAWFLLAVIVKFWKKEIK